MISKLEQFRIYLESKEKEEIESTYESTEILEDEYLTNNMRNAYQDMYMDNSKVKTVMFPNLIGGENINFVCPNIEFPVLVGDDNLEFSIFTKSKKNTISIPNLKFAKRLEIMNNLSLKVIPSFIGSVDTDINFEHTAINMMPELINCKYIRIYGHYSKTLSLPKLIGNKNCEIESIWTTIELPTLKECKILTLDIRNFKGAPELEYLEELYYDNISSDGEELEMSIEELQNLFPKLDFSKVKVNMYRG